MPTYIQLHKLYTTKTTQPSWTDKRVQISAARIHSFGIVLVKGEQT